MPWLAYESGKLSRYPPVATGTIGEDVTMNVRTLSGPIPAFIPLDKREASRNPRTTSKSAAKCSCHCRLRKMNEEREQKGLQFSPPRATATDGTVRQLEPSITAQRRLTFRLRSGFKEDVRTSTVTKKTLDALGRRLVFKVNKLASGDDFAQIGRSSNRKSPKRAQLHYEMDGIVIKVDRTALQAEWDTPRKAQRWAIAYKYAARGGITKIEDISGPVDKRQNSPVAALNARPHRWHHGQPRTLTKHGRDRPVGVKSAIGWRSKRGAT